MGYIPTENAPATCPLTLTGRQPFPIIPAKPWNDYYGPLRQDNTDEVKARWAEEIHIRGEHPCRKIEFRIVSHDQGWGGGSSDRGTYRGSFTWFDVGKETIHTSEDSEFGHACPSGLGDPSQYDANDILASNINPQDINTFPITIEQHHSPEVTEKRPPLACTVQTFAPTVHPSSPEKFEHPLLPTSKCLQKNLTATRESLEHKIIWSCHDDVLDPDSMAAQALEDQGRGRETAKGDYVRDMKIGDIVTVWAKARFPGWVNVVETVQIDVYFAV